MSPLRLFFLVWFYGCIFVVVFGFGLAQRVIQVGHQIPCWKWEALEWCPKKGNFP